MPAPDALTQMLGPALAQARRWSLLTALAGLFWPVQAGLAAAGLGRMLDPGAGLGIGAAAGGFALAGLIRAVLTYQAEARLQRLARATLTRLRSEIAAREAARTGGTALGGPAAVAAMATDKLETLAGVLTRYAPARARVMVVMPVLFLLALWQSWAVAVVMLISAPLIPVFLALVGWAAEAASARQMARIGTLNDLLADRLGALADVIGLRAGPRALADLTTQSDDLAARSMAVLRIAFLSSAVIELFAALGVAMVAVWVGFSLLGSIGWGGWGSLTPAEGIFLLLIAPEFYQPLRDLAAAWHDRAGARAAAAEFIGWQDEPRRAMPGIGPARPAHCPATTGGRMAGAGPVAHSAPLLGWQGLRAALGTDDATAATRGGQIVYPDAHIRPGEMLAVTGPSGVGKTTLLRLLAGLETPQAGRILVDGTPLEAGRVAAWRARLGWMPQAPHFLDASVRYNLALGRAGDLGAALAMADASGLVTGLPQGDLTRLGDGGGGLSGGEARRLTLARALFAGPALLLADEPTADLDPDTAARVTDALSAAAARGTAVIIATHDRALAARCSRVLALGHAR